jgi:hypothetical protein
VLQRTQKDRQIKEKIKSAQQCDHTAMKRGNVFAVCTDHVQYVYL